jgi:hypothetical protein
MFREHDGHSNSEKKLVASDVLINSMVTLPSLGASVSELRDVEQRIGVVLDPELSTFLKAFNGACLDVIRIYSCQKLRVTELGLEFASDPSGFVYYIVSSGDVLYEDTDGGEIKQVAGSVQDFFHSYLFGKRSAEFAGEEWHQVLVQAGIAT